jgi:hypothetical protein
VPGNAGGCGVDNRTYLCFAKKSKTSQRCHFNRHQARDKAFFLAEPFMNINKIFDQRKSAMEVMKLDFEGK